MANPIDAAGDIGMRRVASALRGWQNYHMDVRGWSDIAYQIAIDQAGRAWTLRGLNIRSAANGDADVNLRFGAFLLVLAPGEQPSAAMIATTKGVIVDFRKRFPSARLQPYGHRDVRPRNSAGEQTTDCPGPIAEALIQSGKFTPTASTGGTVARTLNDEDGIYIRALVQAEIEEFAKRLYGEGGSAGEIMQRMDAFHADATNRLIRIEADTDKGDTIPTIPGTTAEPKPA